MTDLVSTLREAGAVQHGDFTLTSGKKSLYYIDLAEAIFNNRDVLYDIVTHLYFGHITGHHKTAGIETGAIAFVMHGFIMHGVPYVTLSKRWGRKTLAVHGPLKKGEKVLLIDDVATTGGSLVRAVKALRKKGAIVSKAVVVVDREEGAAEALQKANVTFSFLTTARELMEE